jgi:hypothetical protein
MGGVVSSVAKPLGLAPKAPSAPAPAPVAAPAAPKEAQAVKASAAETQVAANTRARRRMGTRLLFSAERSANLGQNQTTLGGGAGPGQNTLA